MDLREELDLKFISNDILEEVKDLLLDINLNKDHNQIKNSYYDLMEKLTNLYRKSSDNTFRNFVASSVLSKEHLEKTLVKEQVVQKEIHYLISFLQKKLYSLILR